MDANKYFIILPDCIGTGKSSQPSDGQRAQFPRYDYDDMVAAQHRLLTEGFQIQHVRVILGNSTVSMPSEMLGRNGMMRCLITDSIRNDPQWLGVNDMAPPRSAQVASVFYAIGALVVHPGQRGERRPWHDRSSRVVERRAGQGFERDAPMCPLSKAPRPQSLK